MRVEGYFGDIKAANETVGKLKNLGVEKAFVDMNDHYIDDRNVQTNIPGTENTASLSSLIIKSGGNEFAEDKAPLNASSPMVSGFGRFEEVTDVNCKVIAEVSEGQVKLIKKTIEDMGGNLSNPNIKKPKLDNEEEIALYNSLHETRRFIEEKRD